VDGANQIGMCVERTVCHKCARSGCGARARTRNCLGVKRPVRDEHTPAHTCERACCRAKGGHTSFVLRLELIRIAILTRQNMAKPGRFESVRATHILRILDNAACWAYEIYARKQLNVSALKLCRRLRDKIMTNGRRRLYFERAGGTSLRRTQCAHIRKYNWGQTGRSCCAH
jgi:hypothetical protein